MLEKSQSTKIFLPLLSLFSLDKWAELISDPSPSDQVFVLRFVSQPVSLSHIAVCFFALRLACKASVPVRECFIDTQATLRPKVFHAFLPQDIQAKQCKFKFY